MERPGYIDISTTSSRAPSSADTTRVGGYPSPRIQHFDGDVPPILSPLDAFAAESRRLAKELEATRVAGERRMSRLPPQVVTQSLSQHYANRPACFRTLSSTSQDPLPPLPRQDSFGAAISPEINEPRQRPTSSYPRFSAVEPGLEDEQDDGIFKTPREYPPIRRQQDYFEIQRTQSPLPIYEHPIQTQTVDRTGSSNSQSRLSIGLAPPSAPFAKNKSYHESSDDDYTSSNAGSTFSAIPRKLSGSSGMSFPVSPALRSQHERSPSTRSDISCSSLNKQNHPYNFSRPISQTSINLKVGSPSGAAIHSLERKSSHMSEETRGLPSFEDDRSVISDGFATGRSSSYTHRKFSLPRGKMSEKAVDRVSQLFSGLSGPTFGWQEPILPGASPLGARTENGRFEPRSPTFRPSLDPGRPSMDPGSQFHETRSSTDTEFLFGFEPARARTIEQHERPSSSRTVPEPDNFSDAFSHRPSTSHGTSSSRQFPMMGAFSDPLAQRPFTLDNAASFDRNKMPALPPIPGSAADDMSVNSSRPQTRSERSASTVRPTTARSHSDYQALSADEHVDKAIELHQHGDLKESTYHLRIAAKQNHPTGMLLYALACRHGWGMRANPKEGVALLRKAVEMAQLEVAEDEDVASSRPKADFMEKKSHRAQFALAIYELGISHLNGWGVEQDKALALDCFEIAGNWGDPDALTEAGFCYAEGVGCKKNLKKAAKFYRMAGEKGVSMVGNSWIYKDKYNDDDDKNDNRLRPRKASMVNEEKEEKLRSKSKTRSIFGRKRGTTLTEKVPSPVKLSMKSQRA